MSTTYQLQLTADWTKDTGLFEPYSRTSGSQQWVWGTGPTQQSAPDSENPGGTTPPPLSKGQGDSAEVKIDVKNLQVGDILSVKTLVIFDKRGVAPSTQTAVSPYNEDPIMSPQIGGNPVLVNLGVPVNAGKFEMTVVTAVVVQRGGTVYVKMYEHDPEMDVQP